MTTVRMTTRKMVLPCLLALGWTAAQAGPDGSVTLNEYHRDLLRSWHALDLDGNGYVSHAELKSLPKQAHDMLDQLRRADTDGDGRLTFKEVVDARMAAFDAADLNHDDVLSRDEIKAYEAKLQGERKRPSRPDTGR